MNVSLYVGNLDKSVDETQLFDLFSTVTLVVSVKVCRVRTKEKSLCYAHVDFTTGEDGHFVGRRTTLLQEIQSNTISTTRKLKVAESIGARTIKRNKKTKIMWSC